MPQLVTKVHRVLSGSLNQGVKRTWAKDKAFFISTVFLFLLLLVSILGITPHDPYAVNIPRLEEPPSGDHWFGTDWMGRDTLSRIIIGGRSTFFVAFVTVLIPLVIGTPLGIISGYKGGIVDEVIMRIVDTFLSFPAMILALGIINALSPGLTNAVISIGIIFTPRFLRMVRGQVLKLSKETYIEVARAIGASNLRIMLFHILPGIMPLAIVQASLGLGVAIQVESSLSFLGLGAQTPEISWGLMIRFAFLNIGLSIWPVITTASFLALTIISFNYFGDGLRKMLDVRTR